MSAQSSGRVGLQPSTVKNIAESRNIHGISMESANNVARAVTTACRSVIRTAMRFQRAGRRKQLLVEDVDAAIRLLGLTPPFGYDYSSHLNYRFAGSLFNDVDMRDDREVELQPLLSAPLPKLPLAPVLRAHWLVIDGKQPATPENPSPSVSEYNNLLADQQPSTSQDNAQPPLLRLLTKRTRKALPVQIKTTTTHSVCLEQQVFFKEVMEAVMGSDETKRNEALNALQTDCGLQSLLPRFSVAIAEGVRCNVAQHNLALLIYHMRILQSLSVNKNLSLERVLHEVLPSILTCILSKKLCSLPNDNHWALREFSSKLLYGVCNSYASATVRVRVIKVLSDVFTNPSSSLTTICSAVIALIEFGDEVIKTSIAPVSTQLYAAARKVLSENAPADEVPAATKLIDRLSNKCRIPIPSPSATPVNNIDASKAAHQISNLTNGKQPQERDLM